MSSLLNTLLDLALSLPEPLWLLVWGAALFTLGMYRRSASARSIEEPARSVAAPRPASAIRPSLAPQGHS